MNIMIHECLHKFVLEQLMVTGYQQNMSPRIMMNVGNPETAFSFGQLPNEGIGLARLEFVSWTQHLAVLDIPSSKLLVGGLEHVLLFSIHWD